MSIFKKRDKENYDVDEDIFDKETGMFLTLFLNLEEFSVGNYITTITLINLLIKKGIITEDEFLKEKEKTKNLKDIKELLESTKERQEILSEYLSQNEII